MAQLAIASVPRLAMPPPTEPRVFPLAIVRPAMVALTLADAILKMRKLPADPLRCTLNRFAPGPLIVRFLSTNNSALVSAIVLLAGREKLIVSLDDARRMACRSVQSAPG